MDINKEIKELETKVEGLQKQQSVAEGRFEVAKEALEAAGFESVEQAKTWIEKEVVKLDKDEEELTNDIAEFKSTYAVYLEGASQ